MPLPLPKAAIDLVDGRSDSESFGSGIKSHEIQSKVSPAFASLIPEGQILHAYRPFLNKYDKGGFVRIDTEGRIEKLFGNPPVFEDYDLESLWYKDGVICGLMKLSLFGIADYQYVEIDPLTGDLLYNNEVPLVNEVTGMANYLPFYVAAAYNPDDDRVYAFGSNERGNGYAFVSAPSDAPEASEAIIDDLPWENMCASVCWNDVDKSL